MACFIIDETSTMSKSLTRKLLLQRHVAAGVVKVVVCVEDVVQLVAPVPTR